MIVTRPTKRFRSWRDWVLTPLIEILILTGSVWVTLVLHGKGGLSFFVSLLIFYLVMVVFTLIVLWLVRHLFSLKRGLYSMETRPWTFYGWRLHSFLCATNLFLPYVNVMPPPIMRKCFYRLLGAKFGRGVIPVAGKLLDPYLITIEEAVMIEDEALLIPHGYAVGSSDILILDRIEVKKGAVVGARATLMPGVTLGENSMVKAMSLVPMNTKIPPNEIWDGIPAQKVAEVDRPIIDNQ